MNVYTCTVTDETDLTVWGAHFAATSTMKAKESSWEWYQKLLLRKVEVNGVTLMTKGLTINARISSKGVGEAINHFMGEILTFEEMDELGAI